MKNLRSQIADRLRGLILPKPVSTYKGIEIYRCQSDSQLVTKNNLSLHGGHYVRTPVVLTLKEKVLIWLKIVK